MDCKGTLRSEDHSSYLVESLPTRNWRTHSCQSKFHSIRADKDLLCFVVLPPRTLMRWDD